MSPGKLSSPVLLFVVVEATDNYAEDRILGRGGQLKDKSHVYSFGVVLAELIAGKRPLGMERCQEGRNLATYFVKKEVRLHEILDMQIVEEATDEQLKAACDLVYRCLKSSMKFLIREGSVTNILGFIKKATTKEVT
nr:wall-associated receptor kinase 2-like [Tanacetum cinerariifolium]